MSNNTGSDDYGANVHNSQEGISSLGLKYQHSANSIEGGYPQQKNNNEDTKSRRSSPRHNTKVDDSMEQLERYDSLNNSYDGHIQNSNEKNKLKNQT